MDSRTSALDSANFMTWLRHLLSIIILPITVTAFVPSLLLPLDRAEASVLGQLSGTLLLILGVAVVASTIWHFATRGRGTLAPWDPPRHLVVSGIYRHVRNPMISGVMVVLIGESLFFASWSIAVWAAIFFAINATYIPIVEERGLLRRFGAEYDSYRQHVPRWIPKRSAWDPSEAPIESRQPLA
jgi:protein-S-isoprenylcysteine O-methyltransferase Ste14